jgi:hypothetical protein
MATSAGKRRMVMETLLTDDDIAVEHIPTPVAAAEKKKVTVMLARITKGKC